MPRGHSQKGLGLLPKKASYSLWEGFPLPGWKGWFAGVTQSVPAQPAIISWISGPCTTRWCTEEPWDDKLPSYRLAASSKGLSFTQIWTRAFPHGRFLAPHIDGHKPQQSHQPTCESPHADNRCHIKLQQAAKELQPQELTCHCSGSHWGCVTAWTCPRPPPCIRTPKQPVPQAQGRVVVSRWMTTPSPIKTFSFDLSQN